MKTLSSVTEKTEYSLFYNKDIYTQKEIFDMFL